MKNFLTKENRLLKPAFRSVGHAYQDAGKNTNAHPESCLGQSTEQVKKSFRKHLLALRGALEPDTARRLGCKAQEKIMAEALWQEARSVALYVAVRGEMFTDLLFDTALRHEKAVYLPRCLLPPGEGRMEFARCCRRDELARGPFNLLEPTGEALSGVPDLLILPAVGLDEQGIRLGYGGGYYDRLLRQPLWGAVPRLGFVFALQIVNRLPCEIWDIPVHGLASEEGVRWL